MGVSDVAGVAQIGIKLGEGIMKEIWSHLDAASEKNGPSQRLTENGIKAIQGVSDATQGAVKAVAG